MTNLAAVVRAARAMLTEQPGADWSDPDSLTDEQLRALAGPGLPETELWDKNGTLPHSIAGLKLLAGMIEIHAVTWSNVLLQRKMSRYSNEELLEMAGAGYAEVERYYLTGELPESDAGRELLASLQATEKKHG